MAHNGIGTFSTRYGKFDDMVLGMQVVLPNAEILDIRAGAQALHRAQAERNYSLGS